MRIEVLGTIFFIFAVIHTFLCGRIMHRAHHAAVDSFQRSLLHLLGEVEVVFGIWATLFFIVYAILEGPHRVVEYQQSLNFTEAQFVFVIMVISASKPILTAVRNLMVYISWGLHKVFSISPVKADVFVLMILGPLAGSLITEPAAMTVTAILLSLMFTRPTAKLAYGLIAVLFVNISIGGALTPFAAPPILMVAKAWNWDFLFIIQHFGWKTILAVVLNSLVFVLYFSKELNSESVKPLMQIAHEQKIKIPFWVTLTHFIFLFLVVANSHYQQLFFGLFLLFIGLVELTKKYHNPLRLKESLLVAFFLAGIIVFGSFQRWWLEPVLVNLSQSTLFYGAVFLTSITDNAALTYLGSQVSNLSEVSKYALVSGAIAGGGLTIIANAPNAAGFSILSNKFPDHIIKPQWLFVAAVIPTIIAIMCLWILPF